MLAWPRRRAARSASIYLAPAESPRRARDSACRAPSRVSSHVQGRQRWRNAAPWPRSPGTDS
eukprot:scaffold27081_cov27-Phaeocystis_antarctica.AAC.1